MTGPALSPRPAPVDAGCAPAGPLLSAVFDASAEAMVLCADDHTVLLANPAAHALVAGLRAGGSIAAGGLPALVRATAERLDDFVDEGGPRLVRGRRHRLAPSHYVWYLRDCTEDRLREQAMAVERARTGFLAEASRRLSASLHQGRCVRTTVDLAVAHLADAAVVMLPPDRRRIGWVRAAVAGACAGDEGTIAEPAAAEVPGLAEALAGFPPVPSRWLDPQQAPDWLLPDGFGEVAALLVLPLPGNGVPAGALVLARRAPRVGFSDDEEVLARIFAARAGAAISAAALYRQQVDTAAILQADLLPPDLPRVEGLELVGAHRPAQPGSRIGGDFYDVYPPTPGASDTMVVLGDVCGKGAQAAVLTGKVRQTLRSLRVLGQGPEAMLRVLNQALLQTAGRGRFVTLVLGTVTRAGHGRIRLTLAAAGHPAPLVLRRDGTVEAAATRGTLVGVVRKLLIRPVTVELAPGELCLLYSDGLTEARGGPGGTELYGEQRLRTALAGCRGMPAAAAVQRVEQLVCDWGNGAGHDDIALLALGAPARAPLTLAGVDTAPAQRFVEARRPGREGSR